MDALQQLLNYFKARNLGLPDLAMLLGGAVGAFLLLFLLAFGLRALWRRIKPLATLPKVPALCGCAPQDGAPPHLSWLEKTSLAIDYLRTLREWRYQRQWILLLGQQGSGKSSLIASLSPTLRQGLYGEQTQLEIEGVVWHGVNQGFLIDPEGRLPVQAAQARLSHGAPFPAWDKVLRALDNLRPERAIDGVLLTVSAASLLHASLEERQQIAENTRQQLQNLEQQFEFALPVYVVVTQTDCVPGFAAFWRSQTAERRDEIFGWSCPTQQNEGAPASWADAAFSQLDVRLKALQVEAAAAVSPEGDQHRIARADADPLFLFPRQFQQLRRPFQHWLSTVFQATPWQTTFFCRGAYFTGVIPPYGQQDEALQVTRNDVSFVTDLLCKKVLAERALARPTRAGIWSRNALIRRLQVSGLVLAAALALGFCIACQQISQQVDDVVGALKLVQQTHVSSAPPPLNQVSAAQAGAAICVREETVFQLINQISKIDADAQSLLIPLSWFDQRLSKQSAQRLANQALKTVVLPGVACQINLRAQELAARQPGANVNPEAAFPQALEDLMRYVQQVNHLETNITRLSRLQSGGRNAHDAQLLQDFLGLVEYAYRTTLPARLKNHPGLLPQTLEKIGDSQAHAHLRLPENLRQATSSQIHFQAEMVQQLMLREIGVGAALLTQLEEKRQPVLGNIRDFTRWLSWVRKSWLGSSAANNPILQVQTELESKLQPLITRYNYPANLLRSASAGFDAAKNYPKAMQNLSAMQLPEYGALFVQQNGQLDLNPKLLLELAGMELLSSQEFMRLDPNPGFVCNGKIAAWNPAYLNQAGNFVKQYQAFNANPLLKGADQQALFQKLARHQLGLAMARSLQQAQTLTNEQSDAYLLSNAEQQESSDSASFGKLLPALLNLHESMQKLGFHASALSLNQCARQYANDHLGKIALLAEQSQLYQAPYAAQASSADAYLYELGATPALKDYLSRQLSRAQVLAGYAGPYVDWLTQSQATASQTGATMQNAGFWSNTQLELKTYLQAKDPNGQVSHLENLFLKQLAEVTYGTCSKTLASYASPVGGNDLFSQHRLQLEKQLSLRCKGERSAQAQSNYMQLAGRFNRELAGRYPFGPLSAPDANLYVVRNFFAEYANNSAALKQSMSGLSDPYWDSARQFLNQLDGIATFMNSSLLQTETDPAASANAQSPGGNLPASALANGSVKLNVNFRAQLAASIGAEQIANWSLSSASRSIAYPNRGSTLEWPFGQALVFDMEWANRSAWLPLASGEQSDLQVDGNTASFASNGNWALLRMIERHKPKSGPQTDPADSNRLLLEFNVPLTNANATAGKNTANNAPASAAPPVKAESAQARLYLSLQLSGKDPKTKAPATLKLPPAFPRTAPQ
ncbi:type VI secretion system protein [Massilia sp. W12]|uniref:type VI secretion system protein n=1 Tax=Massilia sp. W12 TaxID=3126507 RepID=UPI0030D29B74